MRSLAYHACVVLAAGGLISMGGRPVGLPGVQERRPLDIHAAESCGAARDLVVQALEELGPRSGPNQLDDSIQLLKRASDLCSESGDAWYYRSLVEKQLHHTAKAEFAYSQAKTFDSPALEDQANPFVLATPESRGVGSGQKTANAPQQQGPTDAPSQKWALVIGIGQFNDRGIRQLQYTTSDADSFAGALKDPAIGQFPAENVRVLTNAQATARNIKAEINWIARHASANDLVVIYVATHGSPRSMDSVGGVNYLVTYDTEMFPEGKLDEDTMYATAFPMVELANAVSTRMKSLRTLVVLDTCYSGGSFVAPGSSAKVAAKSAGPTQQMLEKMGDGTGRIVMAASQADEESLESAALGHGFFTYYLLQALKTDGARRPMTQIFSAVAENVEQRAAAAGSHQHPVMFRSSPTADFSLQFAPSAAAVSRKVDQRSISNEHSATSASRSRIGEGGQ